MDKAIAQTRIVKRDGGAKSVNPCHIKAVSRVAGNKKPQLITVGVSYLVVGRDAGLVPTIGTELASQLL